MTSWTQDITTEKPEKLTMASPTSYIQRRNIHSEEVNMGEESCTQWVSESRIISIDEYNLIESIKEIRTEEAIDEYTLQLIEEGLL